MVRTLGSLGKVHGWRAVIVAGVFAFSLAPTAALTDETFWNGHPVASFTLTAVSGALAAFLIVGTILAARVRRKLSERNQQLDGALNSMSQGLCMFDAQDRLVLWNQRYLEMYGIDPKRVSRGCSLRDLLEARRDAGTFPLELDDYVAERHEALKKGGHFTLTAELADGRITTVVYHAMAGGGCVAMHEDVTARVRAQRELEHTRAFLGTVIENVPSPIIVKNPDTLTYLLINRAAENYFGVDRSTILGKTVRDVMPQSSADFIETEDRRAIAAGQPIFADEHAIMTPGNGMRIAIATRLPVMGADGKPQYLISLISDVTERKRQEERLAHMAHHDALTGLPNRAAFNDCLAATLALAQGRGEKFAVLSIDLDRFKAINDVFGHATGDVLLREVAQRMGAVFDGSFLARIGGDEFAVITPAGLQPEDAEMLAERLCEAFETDVEVGGQTLRVGLTIGVAVFPQDGATAAALMANADAALFRAKTEARGSIRFFEPAMDATLREKRALQQDLRLALARDEITLHYQPQAKIDGSIIGFEALVRWRHPRHGLVPPSTFVPLAEESGLIAELGAWILRAACREATSWPRPLSIGVNLSPLQFEQDDLPRLVHEVLLETGLRPERLELEITEGVLIGDFDRGLAILRRLKNLGVRIAMDDFGTGYSSLSYLQSFPFDKIKIDRAFIANVCHSEQAAAIVRSVIALGRGLDLPVLAEGVETEQQLRFLAEENCAEIQGYLIGRPKPIADYAREVGHLPMPRGPHKRRLAAG